MPTGVLSALPGYWSWIERVSVAIRSDGCSGPATNAFLPECQEHDIQYRFARDARDAYALLGEACRDGFPLTDIQAIRLARPITRAEADRDLKLGIQARSTLGKWSPIAWTRYLVLAKWKRGQGAWDERREQDRTACRNCARRERQFATQFCGRPCFDAWAAVEVFSQARASERREAWP